MCLGRRRYQWHCSYDPNKAGQTAEQQKPKHCENVIHRNVHVPENETGHRESAAALPSSPYLAASHMSEYYRCQASDDGTQKPGQNSDYKGRNRGAITPGTLYVDRCYRGAWLIRRRHLHRSQYGNWLRRTGSGGGYPITSVPPPLAVS
jgi:hypothetical protein